jgi:hypothetical protein
MVTVVDDCILCGRAPAELLVGSDRGVCGPCARATAEVFNEEAPRTVTMIWGVDVTFGPARRRSRMKAEASGDPTDAETAVDLAAAYAAKGLVADAFAEAAVATLEARSTDVLERAVKILLSNVRPDGLATLTARIRYKRKLV